MSAAPVDELPKAGSVGQGPSEIDQYIICFGEGHKAEIDAQLTSTPTNKLTTSLYSFWSFLPKSLFHQFTRAANLFFLFISILQVIPGLSPSGRFTTLFPLVIVISFSMLKEALEDIQRHAADREVNQHPTRTCDPVLSTFVPRTWGEVRCGDIIEVHDGEAFPADLVLLCSTGDDGAAFVQTASLDGETNLKYRQALPELASLVPPDAVSATVRLSGRVVCDPPNKDLYRFDGRLCITAGIEGLSTEASTVGMRLTADQLLLRGAILRNTGRVWGVVVGTGEQSKIALNLLAPVYKRTTVERETAWLVLGVAGVILVTAVLIEVGALVWQGRYADDWYLGGDAVSSPGVGILTNIILMNGAIPISLIVSLEFAKFFLAKWVCNDRSMYDESQEFAAKMNTSSLIEELGQISHVFSDKTGTLTCNCMRFCACSVGGQCLQSDLSVAQPVQQHTTEAGAFMERHVCFDARQLVEPLTGAAGDCTPDGQTRAALARAFLTALAVCHSALPRLGAGEEEGAGPVRPEQLVYDASSPDEGALVAAAKHCGFVCMYRDPRVLSVYDAHAHKTHIFQILYEIEFTSDRKRMSLVVRQDLAPLDGCVPHTAAEFVTRVDQLTRITQAQCAAGAPTHPGAATGACAAMLLQPPAPGTASRVVVFTKGADSAIMPRLATDAAHVHARAARYRSETAAHLEALACEGLRTLCIAGRVMPEAEFAAFHQEFTAIDSDYSRTPEQRQEAMDPLHARIEQGLALLGATGIEDRLQDEVPATIQHLREAGVSVWVLTGDKVETAINIGYGTRLLTRQMDVMQFVGIGTEAQLDQSMQHCLQRQRQRLRRMGLLDRSRPGWYRRRMQHVRAILWPRSCPAAPDPEQQDGLLGVGTPTQGSTVWIDALEAGGAEAGGSTEAGAYDSLLADQERSARQSLWARLVERLVTALVAVLTLGSARGQRAARSADAISSAPLALILDGQTTALMLGSPQLEEYFVQLADLCQAIICCRFSPKQKADIVRLVKAQHQVFHDGRPSAITLAIGDGANDVSMITAAHIGVGIAGREGRQAVRSADVAIGQFRFLRPLMFVHGRLAYRRISHLIKFSFYKNALMAAVLVMYNIFCAYSSQIIVDRWVFALYNVLYTSMPIIFFSIIDRDVPVSALVSNPLHYKVSQSNALFGRLTMFLEGPLLGVFQALIVLGIPTAKLLLDGFLMVPQGAGLYDYGFLLFSAVVVLVTLRTVIISRTLNAVNIATLLLSVIAYIVTTTVYSLLPQTVLIDNLEFYSQYALLPVNLNFWLLLLLIVAVPMLLQLAQSSLDIASLPTEADLDQRHKTGGLGAQDEPVETIDALRTQFVHVKGRHMENVQPLVGATGAAFDQAAPVSTPRHSRALQTPVVDERGQVHFPTET